MFLIGPALLRMVFSHNDSSQFIIFIKLMCYLLRKWYSHLCKFDSINVNDWNTTILFHFIVTCNLVLVSLEGTCNHVFVLCRNMWICGGDWEIFASCACIWISPKNHWSILHPWFVNLIFNEVCWFCNFMNSILPQGLFTIAYNYKCQDLYVA
jgi:hypothetical protein